MKLRSAIASVLLVGAMGLPCLAQPSDTSTPGAHRHHGDMAKQLGLSDAQKAQWQDAMKNNPQGPARQAALKKILTPEQQAKWEEIRKHRRERKKNDE